MAARRGRESNQLIEIEKGGTLKTRVKKDPAKATKPKRIEIRAFRRSSTLAVNKTYRLMMGL
jgi:hypothetical protein